MKNVIVSYKNLPLEVKKAIRDEFPMGVEYELQSIKNVVTGGYFEGVIYSFKDVLYLIKMGMNTPTISLEDQDDDVDDSEDVEVDLLPEDDDNFDEDF